MRPRSTSDDEAQEGSALFGCCGLSPTATDGRTFFQQQPDLPACRRHFITVAVYYALTTRTEFPSQYGKVPGFLTVVLNERGQLMRSQPTVICGDQSQLLQYGQNARSSYSGLIDCEGDWTLRCHSVVAA